MMVSNGGQRSGQEKKNHEPKNIKLTTNEKKKLMGHMDQLK